MQTVLHIFLLAIVYPQKLQHLLLLNAKALPTCSLFSKSSHHHHAMDLRQVIIPGHHAFSRPIHGASTGFEKKTGRNIYIYSGTKG
jgi:hypothetical protein